MSAADDFLVRWHRIVREKDLDALAAEGRIRDLDVMIRPINSLLALRDVVAPQMASYLGA